MHDDEEEGGTLILQDTTTGYLCRPSMRDLNLGDDVVVVVVQTNRKRMVVHTAWKHREVEADLNPKQPNSTARITGRVGSTASQAIL